ncbi:hypothetical protein [Pseudomonas proteolytica]|uniref:hypothetical protein n=1 Tax=Pseudomonas proteolytica TaxID=219574 RepID=UPI0030DB8854
MKLHDTWSSNGMKVIEVTNKKGEQEFRLGQEFDFGVHDLFDLNCHDSESAVAIAEEYSDQPDPGMFHMTECLRNLYALLDEMNDLELIQVIEDLAERATSKGYELYEELSPDQTSVDLKTHRLFDMPEGLNFDVVQWDIRYTYSLSIYSDADEIEYDLVGWLNEFTLDKLHDIYAKSPQKGHLREYSDLKFGMDLGL